MNDLTVVILAAGLGTRMKSRKAKVLHEAGGLTLIEHVVASALQLARPDGVIVVVGHQAEQVRARVAGRGVRFVEQTEQLGTGHALIACREAAGSARGDLVLLYGDGPLLSANTVRRLIEQRRASGAAAALITTKLEDPAGYGRAITGGKGRVLAIVEDKVATPEQRDICEINSGIYCFDAALLWKHISEIQPNPVSKEYYLTDIVEILNRAGHEVRAMLHPDATELLGINTRVELAEVDRIFRERRCRELMLAGVTIERPETVTIDTAVEVGMDSVIEPFARILGTTHIGENCRVGAGSVLRNVRVASRVAIAPYTVIEESVIEADVTIGPFARLRPGSHVHAAAHIGNFVELKNTRMGAGARAGHLAYLGDSEIGSDVNVGAGTITCNFDGAVKHRTSIGEGAFVGSNSTLVAPLEIGPGSYVAAGSVVTQAVPADALAIGRSRQTNKDGWAKQRRERQQRSS
ncbi:MAG TPA: bifunctional UDP-N-acetylglucosamine diphosphorylase/glucosamine-1-phosphate N-acetyltransferase GlmU [Bryobacteraceae bacterium]|nr:bifunctional UDP-N-acetylglucosamine diphosphorylase/glucosamine-1-phosphate N-acetyltransferase GlmU [Bryobacteraceae bacterium]